MRNAFALCEKKTLNNLCTQNIIISQDWKGLLTALLKASP